MEHIEEELDHRYLPENTATYNSNHRKHGYELLEEKKKQVNRIFIDEKLTVQVIIDCRTTMAYNFRTTLGFKQCDVILTKEKLVLTKIMSWFEGENMQTQYNVSAIYNII